MNKYALVTGGNRGLGLGFVNTLLSQDYYVFLCARDISKIDIKVVNNNKCIPVSLDVTDDTSIKNSVIKVSKYTDKLDLLINNAGVSKDTIVLNQKEKVSNINHLDRELLLKMFNINTISPFMIIKSFLPLLSKSSNPFIINISSARASYKDEWGFDSINLGYRGSKAALNMMTYALSYELPKNINIFSVDPGDVHTDMNCEGQSKPTDTAKQIMNIVTNWNPKNQGKFLRFTGEVYPN